MADDTNACRGKPRTPNMKNGTYVCRERMIKTDNKTKTVALRFRESDYKKIKQKADKAKMNFTEFVTTSALGKKVTVIEGLDEVLKEQKAMGKNINQLTTILLLVDFVF